MKNLLASAVSSILLITLPGLAETVEPTPPAESISETDTPVLADMPAPTPKLDDILIPLEDERPFRFELGTRILHVDLQADTKGRPFDGSFIGSIYKLDAEQDYMPLRPYAQVLTRVGRIELGAGISYDALEVATVDDGGGDGDIEMKSWLFYLVGAYPNESRFTPFAEIGYANYSNSFNPIPSWYANGLRNFKLDDSSAPYFAGGCDYAVRDDLSVNVYIRYVDVDIDGFYVFRGDNRPPEAFTFTLEHIAYGVGVKYIF